MQMQGKFWPRLLFIFFNATEINDQPPLYLKTGRIDQMRIIVVESSNSEASQYGYTSRQRTA